MSDNRDNRDNRDKYSLDDILNEYTPKKSGGGIDVDDIINETLSAEQKKHRTETAETEVKAEINADTDTVPETETVAESSTETKSESENANDKQEQSAEEESVSADNETDTVNDTDEQISTAEQPKSDESEQDEISKKESEQPHTPLGGVLEKFEADAEEFEKLIEDGTDTDNTAADTANTDTDNTDNGESGMSDDELLEEKVRSAKNRGAAFTLRTDDDDNADKRPSNQTEYTSRKDADTILRQILKLKNTLTIRAAVLLFAAVFSLFITVANDLSMPLAAVFDRTVNPSAYVFTNTILGLVAIAFSYSVITMGIKSIVKHKADSDSVAAINILMSVIAGIVTLFDPESVKTSFFHIYTAAAIIGLLCNTLGKLCIVRRTQRNFEFVSESPTFSALQLVEDDQTVAYLTNGSAGSRKELATMRRTDFVKDFMKNSYSSDLADRYAEKTTPFMLAAALIVGLLSVFFEKNSSGTTEKLFVFLSSVSGTLAVCSSMALTMIVNRPMANSSKKLLSYSAVMLGYSSVEEFAEVNSVMIDSGHLFPNGTVEFVNLKMLGKELIDECIMHAASMASAGKSITQPAFYKMLRGDMSMIKPVKGCVSEDGAGVSGWIDNKRVLLGNRELMEKHGVKGLPTADDEEAFAGGNCTMYLAIAGNAAMMFAVRLSVGAAAERWVQELEDEAMDIYVRCSDGFISRELLAQLFDISPSTVHILPSACDDDCEREMSRTESVSASMFCSGHLPSFSMLLIAAKRLKFVANLGIALQYGALILGVIVSVIMMITDSFGQVTATVVLIYNLAFLLLTVIMQSFHRL